ncbi:hypothetical protein [Xanthomonas campestris]|uniref:hypothetical protein n=1 Tax=Xanthomonas campestris TaxID=339 RepID=UPI001E5234E3|nr:hypothetical protein [Xanthomonas campestris]MCC5069910.1 hypothetical protein [Xanthomonas campestris]MCC5086241.1 hypothetical protein [Xanthomonas campestris]
MSVVGMAGMGERGSASLSRCHIADALRVRQITQKSRCGAWNCDVCRLYFALSSARPALALASAAALHFAAVMVAFAQANQMRCSVQVEVNAAPHARSVQPGDERNRDAGSACAWNRAAHPN